MRGNFKDLLRLIEDRQYFVLHAPRQTGKTSALIALRDLPNSGEIGDFRGVDVNVEVGQVARDDVQEGMRAILSSLAMSAEFLGDDYLEDVWPDILAKSGPHNALRRTLAWKSPQPGSARGPPLAWKSPQRGPCASDRRGRGHPPRKRADPAAPWNAALEGQRPSDRLDAVACVVPSFRLTARCGVWRVRIGKRPSKGLPTAPIAWRIGERFGRSPR